MASRDRIMSRLQRSEDNCIGLWPCLSVAKCVCHCLREVHVRCLLRIIGRGWGQMLPVLPLHWKDSLPMTPRYRGWYWMRPGSSGDSDGGGDDVDDPFFSCASLRARSVQFAPRRASSWAMPRLMPRVLPQMTAFLPLSERSICGRF